MFTSKKVNCIWILKIFSNILFLLASFSIFFTWWLSTLFTVPIITRWQRHQRKAPRRRGAFGTIISSQSMTLPPENAQSDHRTNERGRMMVMLVMELRVVKSFDWLLAPIFCRFKTFANFYSSHPIPWRRACTPKKKYGLYCCYPDFVLI